MMDGRMDTDRKMAGLVMNATVVYMKYMSIEAESRVIRIERKKNGNLQSAGAVD
jgi:hypothetical protein